MAHPYDPQHSHTPHAGPGYAQPAPRALPGHGHPNDLPGHPPGEWWQTPGPGYPPLSPGPSQPHATGGTAITAAVLALLVSTAIGLLTAIQPWRLMVLMDHAGVRFYNVTPALVVGGSVAFLWAVGAILLFCRKPAGRMIVITMSSLLMLVVGASTAVSIRNTGNPVPELIVALVGCGIPLLILVLTAASSTGRWISALRRPAHPYH